jgi:DNA processing protein
MAWQIQKISQEKFPPALLEIPEPPKALFLVGEIPTETTFLAVVGSRKYTNYGRDACEKLLAGLAGYPITIVSGLALGIDSVAHKSALAAGLKTVAFPGSGLAPGVLYPKTNFGLAKEILAKGGALVSEFEPEFKAADWSFPARNRLMAGISKAVLVIEAGEKSGTLITARLATDYNRDVLAVPGQIFSANSAGPNRLIRAGATPVTTSEEILEALGFNVTQKLFELPELKPAEKEIILLLATPLSRDEIIRRSGKEATETNALLTVLEIKGLVKEAMGVFHRN